MPIKTKNNIRKAAAIAAAAFFLLLTASAALAHKVFVFAWTEGDQVMVEAYFSKSRKAAESLVEVFNSQGQKLVEGKTDENGLFSFIPPEKTDLRIVVEASMGHKNEYLLTADELPDSGGASNKTPGAEPGEGAPETGPGPPETETGDPEADPDAGGVKAEDLGPIINQALRPEIKSLREDLARANDRLENIQRTLAEMGRRDDGPGLRDTVGGLGWLVGLAGLAVFLRGRKTPSGSSRDAS